MKVNLRFGDPGISWGVYELLLKVGDVYSVDPSMDIGAEEFFEQLLAQYSGDESDMQQLEAWLHNEVSQHFRAIKERPKWIQGAHWQYDSDGKPMIFAGQIDIEDEDRMRFDPPLYHDGTSLYIFVSRGRTAPIVVMQQY